jgi:hypothetical protein
MSVASCRSIFPLSDVVFNCASVSPRFGFLIRNWIPISGRSCCGLLSRPTTQPGPARSRAHPHPHAPPLSHFVSRAATPSPSLPPLSHLHALGDPVDGYHRIFDPKVSSSHSPSPSPFPFPACVPAPPPPRGAASWSLPLARSLPGSRSAAFPVPSRAASPPPAARLPGPSCAASLAPTRGPLPVAARRGCPSRLARRVPVRVASARVTFKFQFK